MLYYNRITVESSIIYMQVLCQSVKILKIVFIEFLLKIKIYIAIPEAAIVKILAMIVIISIILSNIQFVK